MCETIFVREDELNEDGVGYYWSPTENVCDVIENFYIFLDDDFIVYNKEFDENGSLEVNYKKFDEALKRLVNEARASYEFEQIFKTKEQKEIKEFLELEHDGKKIIVCTYECYGFIYSHNSNMCNLHCGQRKECIKKMKEIKKKISESFDKNISKAILRAIKNLEKSR